MSELSIDIFREDDILQPIMVSKLVLPRSPRPKPTSKRRIGFIRFVDVKATVR